MSQVAIILKVMPTSPQVDLEVMKSNVQQALESEGGQNFAFEEQEVAFGLKALIVKFAFPESKGTDEVEAIVQKVDDVSSTNIEDYRRAFG